MALNNLSLMSNELSLLAPFRAALIGLPLSHVWRGHGSALFLEFGYLTPTIRRNGTPGASRGQMSAMIEWSWRIEDAHSIICGSWSNEDLWDSSFQRIKGQAVLDVAVFGRLPELDIHLSNDLHVLSFMTAEGDPPWALFDRRADKATLHVRAGQLCLE
jgi:hypothetical protein